jgi:superfamily I DNA/RNA helicase
VTSFSRAAAAELTGRDLSVRLDRVGTLHSHCWQALGGPKIAEANVGEWNRDNPQLKLTPVNRQRQLDGEGSIGNEDEDDSTKAGDLVLQAVNRCRGLMLDPESWPTPVREFGARWERYKKAEKLRDFCDLIDNCLRDVAVAPGSPEVILTDEAQDLTRMQFSLVRKWGERASYFVNAGDDDQTLYLFTGASSDAMLDPPIPDDHRIILEQSRRVPRAVHQFAEALIHQVSRRQDKVYLPRDVQGAVKRLSNGYNCPDYEILSTAVKHLERGKTVMFLASCSYMLRPLLRVLRKNGIPFQNSYRKSNGFWNPLRRGRNGSTISRVLSLLTGHPELGERHEPWTCGDLALWSEWLGASRILKPDAKNVLSSFNAAQQATPEFLAEMFEPNALNSLSAAMERGCLELLEWWRTRVGADFYDRIRFPVAIATRSGPQALFETPRVTVGTIHSVKGGQADVVFLFPDLSRAGDEQYQIAGPPRDSVIRVFYVGATRARETLYICGRETARSVAL